MTFAGVLTRSASVANPDTQLRISVLNVSREPYAFCRKDAHLVAFSQLDVAVCIQLVKHFRIKRMCNACHYSPIHSVNL